MLEDQTTYRCDRCNESRAIRIGIKVSQKEDKAEKKIIDLCVYCAYYGFGMLCKALPENDLDKWLEQFKSGIIE